MVRTAQASFDFLFYFVQLYRASALRGLKEIICDGCMYGAVHCLRASS